MMPLTLPEEVLLLLLHPDTGKPVVNDTAVNAALGGAALLELTANGALRLTETDEPGARRGRLVPTRYQPEDPRLAGLVEPAAGRRPKDAIGKIIGWSWGGSRAGDLRQGLLYDLAGRGLLVRRESRILGLFTSVSWPDGPNTQPRASLVRALAETVLGGAPPGPRTAALVSVLHGAGALPQIFPDQDKRQLKERGRQISESGWAGESVRRAIQEVQAAMAAATMVATTTAVTSS